MKSRTDRTAREFLPEMLKLHRLADKRIEARERRAETTPENSALLGRGNERFM
jgi:hypothetical protein